MRYKVIFNKFQWQWYEDIITGEQNLVSCFLSLCLHKLSLLACCSYILSIHKRDQSSFVTSIKTVYQHIFHTALQQPKKAKGQFLSSVLAAFNVSNEGAISPYEANLCLLLEWTEGRALGKNQKKKPQMGAGEKEWIQ